MRRLLDLVDRPLRQSGDGDAVVGGVERLLASGTGSKRQRAVVSAGGDLIDVARFVVEETVPGP